VQWEKLDNSERIAPLTPSGATDVLLDDAARMSAIEWSLRGLFGAWGYAEVIPPIFERYETLVAGGIHPDWVYRFADPSGEVLALRPDLTTQVARVVATRLRGQPKPLRLFYIGNVVRRPKPSKGQRMEFSQGGIELIGSSEPAADAEVVALAIEALLRLGIDDFQVNLGQSDFFRGIVEGTSLTESQIATIRERLDRKDKGALEHFLSDLELPDGRSRWIVECLNLCGGEEILDRSFELVDSATSKAAVENLGEIYRILEDYHLTDRVIIDLAEVRGLGYYTGMMIEGFSRSVSTTILEGGRYDKLVEKFGYPCPAVGCALDIPRLGSILQKGESSQPSAVDALVRFRPPQRREAYALAAALRTGGQRVELEVTDRDEEEAIAYARQKKIKQLITVEAAGTRIREVTPNDSGEVRTWKD